MIEPAELWAYWRWFMSLSLLSFGLGLIYGIGFGRFKERRAWKKTHG